MNKKAFAILLTMLIILTPSCGNKKAEQTEHTKSRVIVAYATSWSDIIPDPTYMTHINYAFGHVNETFDGVRIDNEERLRNIVSLKSQKPELNILLSIGGWESGGFSEMAADDTLRLQFAKDCQRIVKDFNLDGIDIDWEYPSSSAAGISSSPDDTDNFTLLMRDIRKEIGKDKLLTLATVASAKYINFMAIDPYIDFTNIMTYDMANAPYHHSPLFQSENTARFCIDEAVNAHINSGISPEKLTLGMPFYGRGGNVLANMNYNDIAKINEEYTKQWDDVAKVPYLTNTNGLFVLGFDNPRSLSAKCEYIRNKGLLGGMYWEYNGDNEKGDLRRAVYDGLIKHK